ncbi:MAG: isocitrate lyase/phosphoenolpyruvate mutase family protein [Holosporaceae bacterium]|nr:MAG: isocitrate lyase/phosphoenolpyruvate mutase family protein [Holosporaceae bacterium]
MLAIATSSWAIAQSCGFEDGETIPYDKVLEAISAIVKSSNIPVSADIEAGYCEGNLEKLKCNIASLLKTNVVGINFEDQIIKSPGHLCSIEEQSRRIKEIRLIAEQSQRPLFINARTDIFFRNNDKDHPKLLEEAIVRSKDYHKSGANGLFVPGLKDPKLIKSLCQQSLLPVNVMVSSIEEVKQFSGLGVSRFSTGPFPYIQSMNALRNFVK